MRNRTGTTRRVWLGGNRKSEQDEFFREALDPGLWQPGDAEHWDTCWYTGMPDPEVFRVAGPNRTVSHIPGNNALTVKSRLHATLAATRDRMVARDGPGHPNVERMNFFPRAYDMPRDYHALQRTAHENPEKRWILKPKNAARGKGIRVVSDIATVPAGSSWMVQEYMDRPHTMNDRKYVLRLYVLITSIDPLRVYLYRQGFAKLASEPFSLDDLDNPYIHLTNPDINATNAEAEAPVVFVDLDRYREWLREQGHDDQALFERIRDIVALTMISAREHMRTRTLGSGADPRGCYEMIGLDCLVDADLRPWILECNLSPSMGICAAPEDGGDIEADIKRQLVQDMVSAVGLNLPSKDVGAPTSDPSERIITEAAEELGRAGGFERVWPVAETDRYLPFFAFPRLSDIVLADAVRGERNPRPLLRRGDVAEVVGEDRLALYDGRSGRLYSPNPTASLIWLHATGGENADAIADNLASVAAPVDGELPDAWTLRSTVWDSLADWAVDGLLVQQGEAVLSADNEESVAERTVPAITPTAVSVLPVHAGTARVDIVVHDELVADRLREPFAPLAAAESAPEESVRIEIMRASGGYAIQVDGELVVPRLSLARVVPWVADELLRRAAGDSAIGFDGCLVTQGTRTDGVADGVGDGLWIVGRGDGAHGALAVARAADYGFSWSGGIVYDRDGSGLVSTPHLPVAVDVDGHAATAGSLHESRSGQTTRLVAANQYGLRSGVDVRAVVVVSRGSEAAASGRSMPVDEALAALVPLACVQPKGPPTTDRIAGFANWLSRRQCIALDVTDYDTAAKVIATMMDARSLEKDVS